MSRKKRKEALEKAQLDIANGVTNRSEEEEKELDDLFNPNVECEEFPFLNGIWENEFKLINNGESDLSAELVDEFEEVYKDIVRWFVKYEGIPRYAVTDNDNPIQIHSYKGEEYKLIDPQYDFLLKDEEDFKLILAFSFRLDKDNPKKTLDGAQLYLDTHAERLEHFKLEKELFEDTLKLYSHIIPKKAVYLIEEHLSTDKEEELKLSSGDKVLFAKLDLFLKDHEIIDFEHNWSLFSGYHNKKKSRLSLIAALIGLLYDSKLSLTRDMKSITALGRFIGNRYKLSSKEMISLSTSLKTQKLENNIYYKKPPKEAEKTYDKPRDIFMDFIEELKKEQRRF